MVDHDIVAACSLVFLGLQVDCAVRQLQLGSPSRLLVAARIVELGDQLSILVLHLEV